MRLSIGEMQETVFEISRDSSFDSEADYQSDSLAKKKSNPSLSVPLHGIKS